MIRRTPLPRPTTALHRYTRLERGAPPPDRNPARIARRRKVYQAFLHSTAWRRIRAQKLLASPTCELQHHGCLLSERLTVHHRTYVRFGGKERLGDLQTACTPCHRYEDALHGRHR